LHSACVNYRFSSAGMRPLPPSRDLSDSTPVVLIDVT
jgi:hypothetical protein